MLETGLRSIAARRRDKLKWLAVDPGWVRADMGGLNATLTIEQSIPNLADVLKTCRGSGDVAFVNHKDDGRLRLVRIYKAANLTQLRSFGLQTAVAETGHPLMLRGSASAGIPLTIRHAKAINEKGAANVDQRCISSLGRGTEWSALVGTPFVRV